MAKIAFSTQTHAKWILAGEHTVIRGGPALAFPIRSRSLQLAFTPSDGECRAEFAGDYGEDIHILFWSVLERGLELVGKQLTDIQGKFSLSANIPIGAGLGASAALCVAIARWFIAQGLIESTELYEFARRLEDLFHHKSSGLDIAAVIANEGIRFENGDYQLLHAQWQPVWCLSFSDQIGMTSHCVKKVKELWEHNAELARLIDNTMLDAVRRAEQALQLDKRSGLPLLADAINQTRTCFTQWGLAGGRIAEHMDQLLHSGALAVKPTGSGDGGFVLSLWRDSKDCPSSVQFIEV